MKNVFTVNVSLGQYCETDGTIGYYKGYHVKHVMRIPYSYVCVYRQPREVKVVIY